ncbi:hypothetical protein V500_02506 [Pseudogymnoascus sp. VKM F-4518 (FW-2643)]|nr:hypothetical protein V500_02506 [Pseudogymnoascus sp. VKM F-4518 (FW-2643)]
MAATQEELSALFSRNLSFQPPPPPPAPAPIHQTTPPTEAITYSITQHYHHSSHTARPTPTTDAHTTSIILSRHGVDASSLFPSQLALFQSADPAQQMRLVELWRISPPTYGGHALAAEQPQWPATSVAQEEAMAQARYERAMLEERAARHHSVEGGDDVMSDGEISNAPLTPIQGGGDGRGLGGGAVEPYMASGYEALAAREYEISAQQPAKDAYSHFGTAMGGSAPVVSYSRATDPVYAGSAGSDGWATRSETEQRRAMEDAYGGFVQRGYGGVCFGYTGDQEML